MPVVVARAALACAASDAALRCVAVTGRNYHKNDAKTSVLWLPEALRRAQKEAQHEAGMQRGAEKRQLHKDGGAPVQNFSCFGSLQPHRTAS